MAASFLTIFIGMISVADVRRWVSTLISAYNYIGITVFLEFARSALGRIV